MAAITNSHGWGAEGDVESVYLKTLVEVVKAGSLSRAAESLCVTQPAVSRRIKFLEEQYGCALLDRSGNQVRPTDAGRMVFQKAKALLEIEAELEAGLHRLEGKTRLSFSSTPAFGTAHLPEILRTFMKTCADTADLKFMLLTPNETIQGLSEGLFDVAVLEGVTLFDPSAFAAFPLPDAEMVFTSSETLGVPSPATSIEALLDIPLFARREGCCSRILLERGLKGIGLGLQSFKKVIVLDDIHLLINSVLAGQGTAFFPRDLIGEHLGAGRLKAHSIQGFDHFRKRTLLVNQRDGVHGPLAQFVAAVLLHFGLSSVDLATPLIDQEGGEKSGVRPTELVVCSMSGCTPEPQLPTGRPTKTARLSPFAAPSSQR